MLQNLERMKLGAEIEKDRLLYLNRHKRKKCIKNKTKFDSFRNLIPASPNSIPGRIHENC